MRLVPGMPSEAVLEAIGTPAARVDRELDGEPVEVWVYTEIVGETNTTTVVDEETREVPDPIIPGNVRYIQVPIYGEMIIRVNAVSELYFVEGRLISWKQATYEEVEYP